MKHIFLYIPLLFPLWGHSQNGLFSGRKSDGISTEFFQGFSGSFSVEARNGRAVIVRRDTSTTGEVSETAIWIANPKECLQGQISNAATRAQALKARLDAIQQEVTRLGIYQKQLSGALETLEKGVLIDAGGVTAGPGPKMEPPPPAEKKPPPKKKKKRKKQ